MSWLVPDLLGPLILMQVHAVQDRPELEEAAVDHYIIHNISLSTDRIVYYIMDDIRLYTDIY